MAKVRAYQSSPAARYCLVGNIFFEPELGWFFPRRGRARSTRARRPKMAASPDPLMLASLPKVTDTELRGLQRECIRLMRLEDDKFPGSQVSDARPHSACACA